MSLKWLLCALCRSRRRWRSIVISTSVCVCVCVCLSARLSPEPHLHDEDRESISHATDTTVGYTIIKIAFYCAILPFFVRVAYGRDSVLLRRCDEIPRGRDNLGVLFPIDNALYSRAFGTHVKTAQPIKMPFGLMTRVGPRYHVLHEEPNPPREEAILGRKSSVPL